MDSTHLASVSRSIPNSHSVATLSAVSALEAPLSTRSASGRTSGLYCPATSAFNTIRLQSPTTATSCSRVTVALVATAFPVP